MHSYELSAYGLSMRLLHLQLSPPPHRYMARALLRALPHGARVLFVGDPDQLPPVGPGRVLADMVCHGCRHHALDTNSLLLPLHRSLRRCFPLKLTPRPIHILNEYRVFLCR